MLVADYIAIGILIVLTLWGGKHLLGETNHDSVTVALSDVHFWHKADITIVLNDVRFRR